MKAIVAILISAHFAVLSPPGNLSSNLRAGQLQPPAPLQISFTIDPARMHLSSEISVGIKIKNVSNAAVSFETQRPDPAYNLYDLQLLLNGVAVPKTAFYRKITGQLLPGEHGSSDLYHLLQISLAPGESTGYRVDLKKAFQITQPGSYSLIAKIVGVNGNQTVTAQPVELLILQ